MRQDTEVMGSRAVLIVIQVVSECRLNLEVSGKSRVADSSLLVDVQVSVVRETRERYLIIAG